MANFKYWEQTFDCQQIKETIQSDEEAVMKKLPQINWKERYQIIYVKAICKLCYHQKDNENCNKNENENEKQILILMNFKYVKKAWKMLKHKCIKCGGINDRTYCSVCAIR